MQSMAGAVVNGGTSTVFPWDVTTIPQETAAFSTGEEIAEEMTSDTTLTEAALQALFKHILDGLPISGIYDDRKYTFMG